MPLQSVSLSLLLFLSGITVCSQAQLPGGESEKKLYLYSKKVDGGIYPDYKLYGYVNSDQKIIIEAKYDFAKPFSQGVAQVAMIRKEPDRTNQGEREQLRWGLINTKDSVLIELEYDELKQISNGNYAGLGAQNSFLFSPQGDTLKALLHNREVERPFNDSLIIVLNQEHKMGLMDSTYTYLVEPEYSWISPFSENRAMVYLREDETELTGYINTKGQKVIPLQYKMGGPFADNMAMVVDHNQVTKLINRDGTVIHAFNQTFIDSLITSPFPKPDFQTFETCSSEQQYGGILQSLENCTAYLLGQEWFSNYYESCPFGGECSVRTNYQIYTGGFTKIKKFYEGFPHIEISLPLTDIDKATAWSTSFMAALGFEFQTVSNEPEDSQDKELGFFHLKSLEKASVDISCDDSYCTIRPYYVSTY